MINAGRHILWLGTNLSNTTKGWQGCFQRAVSTGNHFKQMNHAVDQKAETNDNTGNDTSNFEPPPPPGVPRGYLNDHRREMKPVIKELFCGRADTRVFSYPDVLNNDAYHDMFKRCSKVQEILKEKKNLVDSIDSDGKVSKDLLLSLRSQGYYALNIPENEGGEGLSMTETLRLIEELSVDLSLSETIITPITVGYKALQLHGSESLKSKYLPSLISGQKIGALCISDENCGTDPTMVIFIHI